MLMRTDIDSSDTPVRHACTRARAAFTLVEILIVVVILGILAAMVILLVGNPRRDTEQASFETDLKSFGQAATLYYAKTGEFLEDGSSGQLPAGFADYIDENAWVLPTPIGGVWDSEYNDNGVTSAVGVHFNGTGATQNDTYMTQIDTQIDNGDLATGAFRKLADGRFYYIIKD